jgi:hypothetical protein
MRLAGVGRLISGRTTITNPPRTRNAASAIAHHSGWASVTTRAACIDAPQLALTLTLSSSMPPPTAGG